MYKCTCFARCSGPWADEGHGAFSTARLCLCFCMGRNFPKVYGFSSIRASHPWPPQRPGSSRNSTVPSVGFLTLPWIEPSKVLGNRRKVCVWGTLCAPWLSPSFCLPFSLTSAGRHDGSGRGNTLLFHLMPGIACEQGCGSALLGALILQP